MRPSLLMAAAAALAVPAQTAKSPKRGLVSIPNENWLEDEDIWVRPGSPLSWYYNFHWNVTAQYAQLPQDQIEFVPMIWGGTNDTHFLGNVSALINGTGAGIKTPRNISHVLTFNLPDSPFSAGGSQMQPADAARSWLRNIQPLRERGIRAGLPTVAEPDGWWIKPFFRNCTKLNGGKDCEFDFVTLHSFGDYSLLQGRVDKFAKAFPNKPIWITEYGYDNQDLGATQAFFNRSLEYLDGNKDIERYSFFGSFRSVVSNVGPNQAMLDPRGNLTDIGSWYLGGNATGTAPLREDEGGPSTSRCTSDNPCGNSGSSRAFGGTHVAGMASAMSLVCMMMMLY